MSETWRAVVGFEGVYEVSDQGRVRSLDRVLPDVLPGGRSRPRRIRGRILRGSASKCGGYLQVTLCRANQSKLHRYVHRIVMDAFIGPMADGMQTRHLNGNAQDNRLVNLCYGTSSDNAGDKIRHGSSGRKTKCIRGHLLPEITAPRVNQQNRRPCRACQRMTYHLRKAIKK